MMEMAPLEIVTVSPCADDDVVAGRRDCPLAPIARRVPVAARSSDPRVGQCDGRDDEVVPGATKISNAVNGRTESEVCPFRQAGEVAAFGRCGLIVDDLVRVARVVAVIDCRRKIARHADGPPDDQLTVPRAGRCSSHVHGKSSGRGLRVISADGQGSRRRTRGVSRADGRSIGEIGGNRPRPRQRSASQADGFVGAEGAAHCGGARLLLEGGAVSERVAPLTIVTVPSLVMVAVAANVPETLMVP